jgi:integrase
MGLYKRKDSQFYWMSFRVNGRKVTESTKTSNKRRAETIYATRLANLVEARWSEKGIPVDMAMVEVIDRYMAEFSPYLAPTSHERNRQVSSLLKQFFASYKLAEVTPSVVSAYKAKRLSKGYSRETVRRELGILRRIFNVAINEWELCRENPASKVLRMFGKTDNGRVRYLSDEESERLTFALPGWLKPLVTIARHTGLRRGNIVELTWNQVDLERRAIYVPRTKNGEAVGIPLTEMAARVLSDQGRVRHFRSPYVFCDRKGRPHSLYKVSMAFKRACERAGVENFRFHDLRHDFASKLVQNGIPIYTVKELLGHKDLRMTARYSHLAPENLREAVSVLDEKESATF